MTTFRVMLVVLMIGAGIIALYGLLIDTSPARLPLVVSGLAVGGIAAGIFGFSLAGSAVRFGQRGFIGRATLAGFFGGLFVLGAAGALSGAIILGILTTG
jgi:hypothetical protein